jgi:DNA-binding response OmpR family regulator
MSAKMRTLIVDDDTTFCQLLAKVFTRKGLGAEWTTDSLAGYTSALQQPYDLFLLDVRMPVLLGTDFAEGLKQHQPGAKIILISAFADEALRQTAHSLGVALLSKAFTPDRLLEVASQVLGRQV